MRTSKLLSASLGLATLSSALPAQSRARIEQDRRPTVYRYSNEDSRDRAFLGISTGMSGIRDTLGLLITAITAGGPAEKAGLEEGNRIAGINGTSLRVSREDAEEPEIPGLMSRRLIRELRRVKPGEEVILTLWSGGRFRDLKVKTGAVPEPESLMRRSRLDTEDRAVIGLNVQGTGTRRDTLGLFVIRVAPDGPAEKAGIIEGDRIASINGVDVRVSRDDAGDRFVSSAKAIRFSRELRKLKAGDGVELRVLSSNGQPRAVKVTTVRAADLRSERGSGSMFFGGEGWDMAAPPMLPGAPRIRMAPAPRIHFETDAGDDIARFDIQDDDFEHLGDALGSLGGMVGDLVRGVVPAIMDGLVAPMMQDLVPAIVDGVVPAAESMGPAIERAIDDALGSRARRLTPIRQGSPDRSGGGTGPTTAS